MKRTLLALSTLLLIVTCKAQNPDGTKLFPFSKQLAIVEETEKLLSLITKTIDIKDLAQNNKNESIAVEAKDEWQLLCYENLSVVLKKKIENPVFEIYASNDSSIFSTLNILDSFKLDIKSIDGAHLSSYFSTTKIPKSLDSGWELVAPSSDYLLACYTLHSKKGQTFSYRIYYFRRQK